MPLTALRAADCSLDVRSADPARAAMLRLANLSRELSPDLTFTIHTSCHDIESEWRQFQQVAECTPFQTFEWLTTWQLHIGSRGGVIPVIIVARFGDGQIALIAPLAIERRRLGRQLCWLGQELCDYNAPLLARDFSQRVTPEHFIALWREARRALSSDARLRFDWIEFEKMPQTVGVQANPFLVLGVMPHASSAHLTRLGSHWETFYRAARSSATRRRDRTKRKRMAAVGDIRFVTAIAPEDARRTLDILWEQKKRIFARKGISDLFARPGCREFFADLAMNPETRHLTHVSRVDVGDTCAAANFAVVFGDCYYHLLASYCDGQLTRFGPGLLHLRELLAYAIGRGLRLFDFTIGDEQYKLEWCDLQLRLFDHCDAASWRGWPVAVFAIGRRRAKRIIKQTPLLWALVCRLRSVAGPF